MCILKSPRNLLLRALYFLFLVLFVHGPAVSSAYAIEVIDDHGRHVILDTPARRIVSLAPHNTENLFSAGAGQWIVGAVNYSDFPAAAQDIPQVGSYQQVNYEAILALQPDLVVAWSSGNSDAMLTRLQDLGLNLFYSEPRSFEQVIENIRKLSVLAGTQAEVDGYLQDLYAKYKQLKDDFSRRSSVSLFYQVWHQPLITLNGQHLVSQAISVCAGENIFSDLPVIAPTVSVEAILDKDPAVIIIGKAHSRDQETEPWWLKWPTLRAVKNQQVYYVDADLLHRHTARFLQGATRICQVLEQARD